MKFRISAAVIGMSAMLSASVASAALQITGVDAYRETNYGSSTEDAFLVALSVVDPDTDEVPVGAVATVYNQSNPSEVFVLGECGFGCDLVVKVPYSFDRDIGEWVFTVTRGDESDTATFPAINDGTSTGTGPVPGVSLSIPDNDYTPLFSWVSPPDVIDGTANDGNLGEFRVRIQGITSGGLLFDEFLEIGDFSINQFQIPEGILIFPGRYTGQVIIEAYEPRVRSRSRTKFEIDDGDGISYYADNCPGISNPDQADSNGDGFGDACVPPGVRIPAEANVSGLATLGPRTRILGNARIDAGVQLGPNAIIMAGARIKARTIIGRNARIKSDAIVGSLNDIGDNFLANNSAVIGDNVVIENRVRIKARVQIGNNVTIGTGVIIAKNATIGNDVVIGDGAVIFKGVNVPSGTIIAPGARVRR